MNGRLKCCLASAVGMVMTVAIVLQPAWPDTAQDNYIANCARCHGDAGHGDGPSAAILNTKPQDFGDCARLRKISDDTMFNAIKNGGEAVGLPGDMPGWNNDLSDAEIHDLVAYVRAFCKKP